MSSPSRIAIVTFLAFTSTALAEAAPLHEPVPTPAAPPETTDASTAPPAEAVVLPASPTADASTDDAVAWRYDKGLTATTLAEDFELKLGLRSQFRFDVSRPENEEVGARFYIPRLRLQLEGHVYGKANTYKVEYDLSNKGFSALKDFFVERAFSPGVRLRAGQWKKPFNRQELTSDFAQAFNERSPIGEAVGSGRDLGVALHSGYEKSPDGAEWALGVFNGTGEKSKQKLTCEDPADPSACTIGLPSNVPSDFVPELVARVGFNHGGLKGYSELDLEGGPLRAGVGASYKVRLNDDVETELFEHAAGLDAVVKVAGFDVTGGVFLRKLGAAKAELGGYGQAGVVAVPKRVALAVRAGVAPHEGAGQTQELLGSVNLLANGHSQKLVIDGGVIRDTESDVDEIVTRLLAQLVF